jgi:CelD/BcsL family acetyltransferase involved in cellulose biosynthesis
MPQARVVDSLGSTTDLSPSTSDRAVSASATQANLRSEKETLMEMVKNMEKQLDEKTKKEQHDKERREKEETELINALQKHSR